MKLSVVLITRNEADLLETCLSRLGFEDELIVLDMESIDGSQDVAKRYGARVVTIEPHPLAQGLRNIGLDEATGDWILYLDADEFLPPGYGEKLRAVLETSTASAYYVPFRNIAFGKTLYYGDVQEVLPKRHLFRTVDLEQEMDWPTKLTLFRAGKARWPEYCPHPHVDAEIDGPVERLDLEPIDHHLFRTVEQQLEKHIRYVRSTEPLTYGSQPLTAWVPFKLLYKHMIVQRWWRDGTVGLAEAMLFTIKDWLSVLHEWQWRDYPEVPIEPSARVTFTTAELVHDLGSRSRKAVAGVKRRARRLVDRAPR